MKRGKKACALLFLHVLPKEVAATSPWGRDPVTLFGSGSRLSSRWTPAFASTSRETKLEHIDASRREQSSPRSPWLRAYPRATVSSTGAAVEFPERVNRAQWLRAGSSLVCPFVLASAQLRSFRPSATMTTTRDAPFPLSSSSGSDRIHFRALAGTHGGTPNRYTARRGRSMLSLFEGARGEAERFAAPAPAAPAAGASPLVPNNTTINSVATANTPEGAYTRPEIPKWRHKAVIIPG